MTAPSDVKQGGVATPGPWRIETPEDELIKFAIHTIGERPTVEIWADGEYAAGGFYRPIALVADNDLANARLIAAAPDLVKALEKAEELYQLGILNATDGLCDEVVELRRAALSKASGS